MKAIFLLIIICMFVDVAFSQGDAPTFSKGQSSSVKNVSSNIELPNNQVTKLSSSKVLFETGNQNILSNPGFESSDLAQWDLNDGTEVGVGSAASFFSGAAAVSFSPSSETFTAFQDSTLYATEYADGVQCEASVWIKSNHTTAVSVCPRKAGVTTTDCATVSTDNSWKQYSIPFVCGATSNGISISGVSGTGTTLIDNAYVGPVINLATTAAIGPWITGTCTSNWTTNATTICRYRINGDGIDVRYATTFTGANTQGESQYSLPSGFTLNTSKVVGERLFGGKTRILDNPTAAFTGPAYLVGSVIQAVVGRDTVNSGTSYTSVALVSTTSNIPMTFANTDTVQVEMTSIPVNELNGNVTTYAQPCGANCENVFSASVSSTGVVSGENTDWINGNCSISDTSLFSCTFVSGVFSGSPSCIANVQDGTNTIGSHVKQNALPTSSTAAYRTYRTNTTSSFTTTALNWQLICQKSTADYQASRSIIGSFAALDQVRVVATSTAGTTSITSSNTTILFENETTDTHSAYNPATGVFTVPTGRGGLYSIDSIATASPVTNSTTQSFECLINGSVARVCTRQPGTGGSQTNSSNCSSKVILQEGNTIYIQCASSVTTTQSAAGSRNNLRITRIPGQ